MVYFKYRNVFSSLLSFNFTTSHSFTSWSHFYNNLFICE